MGLESLAAIGDVVHDDAKDVAMTAWSHQWDKRTEKRQLRNQMALNLQGSALAQSARQQSALDMVNGLRAAGLNPALASAPSFGSAGSGGAASAQNSGVSRGSPSGLGNLALQSGMFSTQKRLMDAQAKDLEATAHGKEIDNANKDAENQAVKQLLSNDLQLVTSMYGPDSSMGRWAAALVESGSANVGTLEAIKRMIDAESKTSDWSIKKQSDKLLRNVAFEQAQDSELASLLANVPRYEAQRIFDLTEQIARQNVILGLQGDLLNFDKNKLEERYGKEIKILDQQIEQLETMIKNTKDHNLIDMWEKGEYMKFAIALITSVMPSILSGGAQLGTTNMLINSRKKFSE